MTIEQKETILRLRQALSSYTQIAKETGLTASAVKSYCYRRGLNTEALKNSGGYCQHCGEPIVKPSRTRPRRFCSDRCKTAWWNAHRHDHKNSHSIVRFTCAICGKAIEDYSSTHRKYCSQACYQKRGGCNG